jgi:hypothetical protein
MQTTSDYQVDYLIELEESLHEYSVDGIIKPGYSEIMEFVGLKMPFYPADDFPREFGQAGHGATSLLDLGTLNRATLDPRLVPVINCYEDFKETSRFKVRANEVALYSKRFDFCTKIDRAGIFNGRFGILEIKIGSSIDWATEFQLCAHQAVWEDNFVFEPVVLKYVLHIRKLDKGPITVETRWDWTLITKWTDSPKSKWLSVLDWYKLKKKRGSRP